MLLGLHQLTSPFARPALLRPLGFITPAAFVQVSTLLAWAPCTFADAETRAAWLVLDRKVPTT